MTTHLYPLPEDGFDALFAICDDLDEVHMVDVHWDMLPMSVFQVRDENAALFLRLRFGERLRIGADDDDEDVLDHDDVLVPADERRECEQLLANACRTEHRWFALALVTFTQPAAYAAFAAAYESRLGTGAPCADSGWITPTHDQRHQSVETP